MYAGSIHLIANEKGVGVNNAGQIQTGKLTLSADGTLSNSGSVITDSSDIAVKGLDNSGTLASQSQALSVGELDASNSGKIITANELNVEASALENSGDINAGRLVIEANSLDNSGQIQQTGQQALAITTDALDNSGALGISKASNNPNAPRKDKTDNQTDKKLANKSYKTGVINIADSLSSSGEINAVGDTTIEAQTALDNSGSLKAKQVTLQSGTLTNSGELFAENVKLQGQDFSNTGTLTIADNQQFQFEQTVSNAGQLQVNDDIDWRTSRFDNSGHIATSENFSLTADDADNTGAIQADKNVTLTSANLNNAGAILASENLSIDANDLHNTGKLQGNQLTITSERLDNAGDIQQLGQGKLAIATDTLDNSGNLGRATTATNIQGGTASASSTTAPVSGSVRAQSLTNSGNLLNNGETELDIATSVENTGSIDVDTLTQSAGNFDNQRHLSAKHADLQGDSFSNSGDISATQIGVFSYSNVVDNQGKILSANDFTLSSNAFTNTGQLATSGSLFMNTQTWTNRGEVSATKALNINSRDRLDNSGLVQSVGDLTVTTKALNNKTEDTKGSIQAQRLAISADNLHNQGDIVQTGSGKLAVDGKRLENRQGALLGQAIADDATPQDKANNGSGKTTLFKILARYIYPDSGEITINNESLLNYHKKNKIILVLSQERSFYYRLTVMQNLNFFLSIFRMEKTKREIEEKLDFFELLPKKDSFYYELSTGLKQRLSIVRALLLDPNILLLDEIEKGIDINMLEHIFDYLDEIKKDISIIYSSHQKKIIDRAGFIFEL